MAFFPSLHGHCCKRTVLFTTCFLLLLAFPAATFARRVITDDENSDSSSPLTTETESLGDSSSSGDKGDGDNSGGGGADKQAPSDGEKPLPYPPRPPYALKGTASPIFTCPDGRKGLHIIHTRLMLNLVEARGASGTFRAGRMLLFRDFSLPSIAKQTNQNFIYYASYDIAQDFPFLESCRDIMKAQFTNGASYLYLPEKAWSYTKKAHEMITFPRVVSLLLEHGISTAEELSSLDLYITSRIDIDDATNVNAVQMTQEEACEFVSGEESNRIMVSYMDPKLFWFPDGRQPFGQLATVMHNQSEGNLHREEVAMERRPVMQSLAVDKSLFECHHPINCYTHYHFIPSNLIYARNETDCPFAFSIEHNYKLLTPPDKGVGGLYSRSPGSWYASINNRGYDFLPFDRQAFKDCGVDLGDICTTNLFLAMVFEEAPGAASLSSRASRGFGGIGYMATWPAVREQLYKGNAAYKEARDGIAEEEGKQLFDERVHELMFGERRKAMTAEEIEFDEIATEVKDFDLR